MNSTTAKKTAAKNQIKAIRRKWGWSIEELCTRWQLKENEDSFEIYMERIREAEGGEEDFGDDTMEWIARALGISPEDQQIPKGNRITEIRCQRGWSIHELTIRWQLEENRGCFGGNLDLLQDMESAADVSDFDENIMRPLAKALGVTVDYLCVS